MANYRFTSINLTHATTNMNTTTTYPNGTQIEILVTADDGYYFSTAPYFYSENFIGEYVKHTMYSDDVGEYKQNFYYHYTIDSNLDLTGDAQVIPAVDKYGIITMYNPTPQELKQIGNVRYYSGQGELIDLGNYITSLIKVFVHIPQGNKANVLLGGYNTNVQANVIVDDVVETDCGTINIVGNYSNAMDYENTKVEIYLPLIGFKTLETEKVMNETLSLFYKTNLINGDSIACIYNTTGTLLYTFNAKASFEIPYRLNDEIEAHGRVDVNSNYLFGFTPFVTIRYNKAYNAATTTANDDRETTLNTLQGYVKCSEVFNTIRATTAEKEEIDMLLKSGVIIT